MYVRKRQSYHYLGIIFLIKTMISVFICGHYHTYKVEFLHYHHVIRTDVITMYDIIKFYIEIVYWII